MKDLINKAKKKLFCDKGKHNWEYCTWGSACVDNLDGTFGFWSILMRECKTCSRSEMKLKSGFEKSKEKLTINDLPHLDS